jgi:hypothetical protein
VSRQYLIIVAQSLCKINITWTYFIIFLLYIVMVIAPSVHCLVPRPDSIWVLLGSLPVVLYCWVVWGLLSLNAVRPCWSCFFTHSRHGMFTFYTLWVVTIWIYSFIKKQQHRSVLEMTNFTGPLVKNVASYTQFTHSFNRIRHIQYEFIYFNKFLWLKYFAQWWE